MLNKQFLLFAVIAMMAACVMVFAQGQDKQKVAVYMAGTEPKGALGAHKVVGGELTGALSKSAKYSAIDRTNAILAQLAKEQTYQRTGAVDDAQIKKLGAQFGVQYLCIVEISEMVGGFYLDVRMVDVESAEVVTTASVDSDLKSREEMMRVARSLAGELVVVAVPQQTYTPPPQQTYTLPSVPTPSTPPSPPPPPPQREVSASTSASIYFVTLPPKAKVYIGGRLIGTSNEGEWAVPVGTHQVRFVKDGLEQTVSMTFQPGKNPTRFVNLR